MMELNKADEDKLKAAIHFINRTGAKSLQIRYSDDEFPIIWFVVVEYAETGPQGKHIEVDSGFDPVRAALRLCERLADGGQCKHCKRPTGLEPDSLNRMPLDNLVCWYQYDPELKVFRRGCE